MIRESHEILRLARIEKRASARLAEALAKGSVARVQRVAALLGAIERRFEPILAQEVTGCRP